MREIKIRGQRKYSEEWNYLNLSEFLTSDGHPQPDMLQYLHRNICQFTGLKDINGTDIYEGDIIGNHKRIGVVCWNEKNFRYWVETTDKLNDWFLPDSKYKVLGNIHENPELLTQHKN